MWRNLKCLYQSTRAIYHMIPTIWNSEKANIEIVKTNKKSTVIKDWDGGSVWIRQRMFKAVKTLCDIWWWIPVITHLLKLIEYTLPKANPKINDGLWVIMMCQHTFIDWNIYVPLVGLAFGMVQMVKNLPAMWESRLQSLDQKDPLEKAMAAHCSILAWRTPWTEKPGGLYSPWGHKESDLTERYHNL